MTKSHSDNIDVLLNSSLPSLKKLEGERELILQYSREIINICSKTIESSHTGDKEKAMETGCDDYDTKPVDFQRLIKKINTLLP